MHVISLLVSFLTIASAASAAPGVLLIGDSTVTDGAGWGKGFCAFTKGLARCTNLAIGGTTTTSWPGHATEYQAMLNGCKTANTFATIQFGHNDQKVMTTAQFATNLETLVNKIRTAGCSPILVTSLARRIFTSEYVPNDILGPYSAQTIAVANKLGLPVLPLLADSLAYIAKMGKASSMKFNMDYTTTNKDYTHLNSLGSTTFGRIVADEVKSKISALAPYITGSGSTTTPPPSTSRTTSSIRTSTTAGGGGGAPLYGQCGGNGWTGPTTCASGRCAVSNPYYSQCIP